MVEGIKFLWSGGYSGVLIFLCSLGQTRVILCVAWINSSCIVAWINYNCIVLRIVLK